MSRARRRTSALASILAVLIVARATATGGKSPEQLYKDALAADERGDTSRAISLYKQFLKIRPHSIPVRTNLGVALARAGHYSEAVAQYQQALKGEEQNPITRLNLALAYYKEADFEKAAAELQRLHVAHPENQQSLYLLADCYLRLGRNSDAVALLEPAYQADPEDRAVDYALGTALIRQGEIQRGETVIDRILKDGNSPEANLLVGEAQFAAGDYKTASATLRDALKHNPDLAGGWSLYGRALLNSEDEPGAKVAFQRALQADANDFAANLYLGSVLRRDGDSTAARPYLDRATRLRPGSPEARYQIGALDSAVGHLEKARKELEELEREWPDFLEVHVQLATLYSRLNLKEDSDRERNIVLQLNEKARKSGPRQQP
jgi:tetratricopeptide (TPR) repeat protein